MRISLKLPASVLVLTGLLNAQFEAGSIYREYLWHPTPILFQRVVGSDATDARAKQYLPNPVNAITIKDLDRVRKIELQIERMQLHAGTRKPRVRINGNSWLDIPIPSNVPGTFGRGGSSDTYLTMTYPIVDVPVSQIKAGSNTFEFSCQGAGGSLIGKTFPQWLVFGATFRVHYESTKAHPTGSFVAPGSNSVLASNPVFEVRASGKDGIERVDFAGDYKDVDWRGAEATDLFSYSLARGGLTNHMGTARTAPYRVRWNTDWIPTQTRSFRVTARVVDKTGLTYVVPPLDKLLLRRQKTVVRYRSTGVPVNWVSRVNEMPKACHADVRHNLKKAEAARVFLGTWNGTGLADVAINGKSVATRVGKASTFQYDAIDVPIADIVAGNNSLSTKGGTAEGGYVVWPGVEMLVRYRESERAASYEIFGTACSGTGGTPRLFGSGVPALGQDFWLQSWYGQPFAPVSMITGQSNSTWNSQKLPLDFAPLGAKGCFLLVSPDVVRAAVSDQHGLVSLPLRIPLDSSLSGLSWYNQALWRDPGANALGWVTSNGGKGSISGGNPKLNKVSQFGITWTFDRLHEVGRFANGDWWVVGPVNITNINPASVRVGSRVINGAMLNPRAGKQRLGYDSSTKSTGFDPALNVAFGVSQSKPLTLQPGSSLVSTISQSKAAVTPQLRTAAILTVLRNTPAPGSFRPAYCGTDKSVRFTKDRLDYSLLSNLDHVADMPTLASVERWFERPWLDHQATWSGSEIHPKDNMPWYGRDMSRRISDAALMVHMKMPRADKEKLTIRLVQLGIDLYGIVQNGGHRNWEPSGGHASGRKWPILFAGLMLNDASMKGFGSRKDVWLGEDGQTFYVRETSRGVYNWGYGGYRKEHLNMPEWGHRHSTNPKLDDHRWSGSQTLAYRFCCTANSWGFVTAARIMGAKGVWNHPALFDYYDRYMSEALKRYGRHTYNRSISRFAENVYDKYRSRF